MLDKATDIDHVISELLEEERAAILGGDFKELPALTARKEAALAHLASTGGLTEGNGLRRLRDEIERNARMLKAASAGFRAVISRYSTLVKAGELKTYDAAGGRQALAQETARLQRKA
ncbi:MAG: hypothetical protein AAF667_17980 [Pseudomonadota bacterium]